MTKIFRKVESDVRSFVWYAAAPLVKPGTWNDVVKRLEWQVSSQSADMLTRYLRDELRYMYPPSIERTGET